MKNDIFDILKEKYCENKLSHIYLVESNNIDNTIQKLTKFVKYISCSKTYSDGCSLCNLCRTIDNMSNPNFMVVEADGQTIKKEQLLELQNTFASKPNILNYNIYMIKNAEKMTESAQNTILKFLEEPQDNILGFLITEQQDKLLQTVISRCQKINDFYIREAIENEEIINIANQYYNSIIKNDVTTIVKNRELATSLKNKDDLALFINLIIKYIKGDLVKTNNPNFIKLLNKLSDYLDQIKYNINVELFLDKFMLEMSDIHG